MIQKKDHNYDFFDFAYESEGTGTGQFTDLRKISDKNCERAAATCPDISRKRHAVSGKSLEVIVFVLFSI